MKASLQTAATDIKFYPPEITPIISSGYHELSDALKLIEVIFAQNSIAYSRMWKLS